MNKEKQFLRKTSRILQIGRFQTFPDAFERNHTSSGSASRKLMFRASNTRPFQRQD